MKTIIVGGGPVGFAAAILMSEFGPVEVYEKQKEIVFRVEESYPIGLNERSFRVLREVGLEDQVREYGAVVNFWRIYSSPNIKVAEIESGTALGTTRGQVTQVLYQKASSIKNVQIHFDHNLVQVDYASKLLSFESSGKVVTRDASDCKVLFCDGVYSKARRDFQAYDPHFKVDTNQWPVVFRNLFFSLDPKSEYFPDSKVHYVFRGCYAAVFSTKPKNSWALAVGVRPDQHFLLSNSPSAENVAQLKDYLKTIVPKEVLNMATENDYESFFTRKVFGGQVVRCSKLQVDEWALFMGDAAHGVLPPAGEGINSGLEDTYVLYKLARETTDHLFSRYEENRTPDIQLLGEYADYLNQDLGRSSNNSSARMLFRIGLSIFGKSPEARLFGVKAVGEPYRDILGDWKRSKDRWLPRLQTLVSWWKPIAVGVSSLVAGAIVLAFLV